MRHKLPKQPKPKKLPKKPKQSASAAVWERYDERVKQTHKENAQKLQEWKNKCAHIKSQEHKKQQLIKKYSR